ncbi:hypothetical protein HNV12_00380 [Methanococcoides sp. SA1]|nr:hypothetical protein [Methanococcoides sp. SA1]
MADRFAEVFKVETDTGVANIFEIDRDSSLARLSVVSVEKGYFLNSTPKIAFSSGTPDSYIVSDLTKYLSAVD